MPRGSFALALGSSLASRDAAPKDPRAPACRRRRGSCARPAGRGELRRRATWRRRRASFDEPYITLAQRTRCTDRSWAPPAPLRSRIFALVVVILVVIGGTAVALASQHDQPKKEQAGSGSARGPAFEEVVSYADGASINPPTARHELRAQSRIPKLVTVAHRRLGPLVGGVWVDAKGDRRIKLGIVADDDQALARSAARPAASVPPEEPRTRAPRRAEPLPAGTLAHPYITLAQRTRCTARRRPGARATSRAPREGTPRPGPPSATEKKKEATGTRP